MIIKSKFELIRIQFNVTRGIKEYEYVCRKTDVLSFCSLINDNVFI